MKNFFILFSVFVWIASAKAASALSYDFNLIKPAINAEWQTLSTEHFDIHFEKQHHNFALKVAGIAEKVHAELTPQMQWQPESKTQVVLNDAVDFANGAATPIPYNQFFLYMTPPVGGDLMDHSDWVERAFVHEYTHILHHDQVSGVPKSLRSFFGRGGLLTAFTFPELLTPKWDSEGLAIFNESSKGFGRNHSARYEAKMRQEVLKGLSEFSEQSYEGYYASRWPFGQVYLYGAYFYQFLEAEYGAKKRQEFVRNYNDNLIPWQQDARARQTLGLSIQALWAKFKTYLQQRFQPQIQRLEAKQKLGKLLVNQPYYNDQLTTYQEGILFRQHDVSSDPEIKQLLPSGETRALWSAKDVSYMHWLANKGLLLGKSSICQQTKQYVDLFVVDLQTQQEERLTECGRYVYAQWLNASEILAVKNQAGHHQLVKLNLQNNLAETLLSQLAQGEAIGQFDVFDNQLVASVKRVQTGWNLETFDLDSLQWQPLTQSSYKEQKPQFSIDGGSVYYLAETATFDQIEVFNLNLQTNRRAQLTQGLGFMEDFKVTNEGIWLTYYTGQTQQVRLLAKQTKAISIQTNRFQPLNLAVKPVDKTKFQPHPYQPLATLKPVGWMPLFSFGGAKQQFGISLSGQDVLGFHRWQALPIWESIDDKQALGGVINYSFNNRLFVSAESSIQQQAFTLYDAFQEKRRLQLLWQHPITHSDWGLNISLGSAFEKSSLDYQPVDVQLEIEDQISGVKVEFNTLKQYALDYLFQPGFSTALTWESYDLLGSSQRQGQAGLFELAHYASLANQQVLQSQINFGVGEAGIQPFQLGEQLDALSAFGGVTRLGQRRFALRGYPQVADISGDQFARLQLNYHLPIVNLHDGGTMIPLGLGKVYGSLFSDTGAAWDAGEKQNWYTGVGAELKAELQIGFDSYKLPVTFGYAKGLDNKLGEEQIYFRFQIIL